MALGVFSPREGAVLGALERRLGGGCQIAKPISQRRDALPPTSSRFRGRADGTARGLLRQQSGRELDALERLVNARSATLPTAACGTPAGDGSARRWHHPTTSARSATHRGAGCC